MHRAPLLLLLAACGPAAAPREPLVLPDRPDVLLVTLDTVRADHLGCYGYFRPTSPRLDELAAEGVAFERCLAPMSTTLPTHTSLLTGVWPEEHGVLANLKKRFVYVRNSELRSLAEVFQGAGYDTAAFVSAFPLRPVGRLDDGFDVYDAPEGERERTAEATTDRALAWLAARGDAPRFLWVHYFDAHNPYEAPDPAFRGFATDDALREWLAQRAVASSLYRTVVKRGAVGREVDLLESTNAYDDELRYLDHHLGRLLDALREGGRWERTVVAVVGDHGEGLNQHREPGHGLTWDEQLHVPFVVRAPGLAARREGALTSVVDVGPTLLGLVELEGEEAWLARCRGQDALHPDYEPRPLVAQSSERLEHVRSEVAVTTPRWKYLRRSDGGESLYDLARDPHELHDVAVLQPALVAELRELAEAELEAQRARGGGRMRAASEEEMALMEALGYGGGGGGGGERGAGDGGDGDEGDDEGDGDDAEASTGSGGR